MTTIYRFVSPFALLLGLGLTAGCSHRGEPETSAAVTTAPASRVPPGRRAADRAAATASLRPIFFAHDSAELTTAGKYALDENIALLKRYPKSRILVTGHTDESGDLTYNLNLGEARASNVRAYLTDHGIALSRVVIASQGESGATADPTTQVQARADRTAEFVLMWEATPAPAPLQPEG